MKITAKRFIWTGKMGQTAWIANAQLPLLKVAALWFDKLVILDPFGASQDTIGAAPFRSRLEAVTQGGY